MKRSCKTCKFFEEKVPKDDGRTHTIVGRCKQSAPVSGKGFPHVYANDWCGDWKPDENKM